MPAEGTPPPPPPILEPPIFTTGSLPNGTMGTAYSETLAVQNGTEPYTFAVTAGSLPPGIGLMAATGVLSGTPTAAGSYSFVITVTDAASYSSAVNLSIDVPALPTIENSSLPQGTVEEPYSAVLLATGGTAPYGFQITAGALPAGLTLAATGGITGLPTTPGIAVFTVQVYDSNDPQGIGYATFSLTIVAENVANAVSSLDECMLLGCDDGALYAIIPGVTQDTNYSDAAVGYLQQWKGVPTSGGRMALNQLGGVTIGAKGKGELKVSVYDDAGNIYPLGTARPMMLVADDEGNPIEVTRDFMAKGLPKSERWGVILDNGSVPGAWFEAHVLILWLRPFFSGRKS